MSNHSNFVDDKRVDPAVAAASLNPCDPSDEIGCNALANAGVGRTIFPGQPAH